MLCSGEGWEGGGRGGREGDGRGEGRGGEGRVGLSPESRDQGRAPWESLSEPSTQLPLLPPRRQTASPSLRSISHQLLPRGSRVQVRPGEEEGHRTGTWRRQGG